MIGEMQGAGVGPGSVCAVYHFPGRTPPATVAAFARGADEGVTEWAAARRSAGSAL